MRLPSPHRLSEADLVAEFYHRARLRNIKVPLEVPLPSDLHPRGEMRADAVILDDQEEMVCCIEAKREGREVNYQSRQALAYEEFERQFDVPTTYLTEFEAIDETIEWIELYMGRPSKDP